MPADWAFIDGRVPLNIDGFLCFGVHLFNVHALHARWGGLLFAPLYCQNPPTRGGLWHNLRHTLFCPRLICFCKLNQTITNNIFAYTPHGTRPLYTSTHATYHFIGLPCGAFEDSRYFDTLLLPHTVPDLSTPRRTQHTTSSVYHMGRFDTGRTFTPYPTTAVIPPLPGLRLHILQ